MEIIQYIRDLQAFECIHTLLIHYTWLSGNQSFLSQCLKQIEFTAK